MTEGNQLVVSIFLTTNRWSTTQKELRRTLAPIQCFKVCGSFDYEIRDLVRSYFISSFRLHPAGEAGKAGAASRIGKRKKEPLSLLEIL